MGKQKREIAQQRKVEAARRAEAERREQLRQRRVWVLGGSVVVGVVLAIILVASLNGRGAKVHSTKDLHGVAAAKAQVAGIAQGGFVLGSATGKPTIVEYADLQCPVCRDFVKDVEPDVIDQLVKTGKANVRYEPLPILGDDSKVAARALYAAAAQNRAWQFLEVFYANQADENSGYVTDDFLDAVAKSSGLDVTKFDSDRKSRASAYDKAWGKISDTADDLGVNGTPTIAVEPAGGGKGKLVKQNQQPSVDDIAAAVERAS